MRLTDLDPRWISENVFVFRCPHCRVKSPGKEVWISSKNIAMGVSEQFELFASAGVEEKHQRRGVVPMEEGCIWTFSTKDFATISVSPSVNAESSGHWHGTITNGEIQGGL